jgi:hypothetical protein
MLFKRENSKRKDEERGTGLRLQKDKQSPPRKLPQKTAGNHAKAGVSL